MQNPKLYLQGNNIQHRDATEMILKYMKVEHWQGDEKIVLDIGCGPGDITWKVLCPLLPEGTRIFGADIANDMLRSAAKNYPKLKFFHLDIETQNMPYYLNESFDHIFSNFCLHWVQAQRLAFKNINDMLKPGGNFFTCHLLNFLFYDAYINVASLAKWKKYIQDPFECIPPFQHVKPLTAQEEIKTILQNTGFQVSECKAIPRKFTFATLEDMKTTLSAVNPYSTRIPEYLKTDFFNDSLQEMVKLCNLQLENNHELTFDYNLIVISATKSKLK